MEVRLNSRAAAVFERVSKIYPRTWTSRRVVALEEVSLAIGWGEVFGLIGPNRAGKTTLVKILLSICHPTQGRIMRLEAPWSDRGTLARVGYVHENPAFPGYLTPWQLLIGYGRLSGVASETLRQRAGELLERVGLSDRGQDKISCFSKGMLQRLALAQALINDPRLLVLDEPSEGMDLGARRLLHEIIGERRLLGGSVLLVSHDLTDVERLCDRVGVIRGGRLVFLGSVGELQRQSAVEESQPLEQAVASLYEGALA